MPGPIQTWKAKMVATTKRLDFPIGARTSCHGTAEEGRGRKLEEGQG